MPPDVPERPVSLSSAALKVPGLVVGLGEARALRADRAVEPQDALVAYGLGSCVAVCLWDPQARVAGMAHVVLPGEDPRGEPNPRFARNALPALVALMQAEGAAADPRHLVARLVGGAQVLPFAAAHGLGRVGDANANAMLEALDAAGVHVEGFDLGGSVGRSVWFDPRDGGQIRLRAIGCPDRYL